MTAQIKLKHSGGNGVIIEAPASNPASDKTITLPSTESGVFATKDSDNSLQNITGINGSQLGYRNKIINGSFAVNQRNANASLTMINSAYICDRFRSNSNAGYNDGQVVTDSPDGITQSLKITTNGTHTIGANDYSNIQYVIEGHDIQDLNWGTSAGVSCTLSFFVKCSLTGTFGGAIRSSSTGGFYGYPFSYTISSANTWQKISITIPKPPNASTWLTDANGGIYIYFDFGTGTTYTNAANSWVNQNVVGANGTTKLATNNGATQQFALIQFEKGDTATEYEHKSFEHEVLLCRRYFQEVNGGIGCAQGASQINGILRYQPMRANPSLSKGGTTNTYIYGDMVGTGVSSTGTPSFFKNNGLKGQSCYLLTGFSGMSAHRPMRDEGTGNDATFRLSADF